MTTTRQKFSKKLLTSKHKYDIIHLQNKGETKLKIIVFDTETVNLQKPYCYNVGYVIADTETEQILLKRDYVIEQIWHNMALFNTAYYADKRPIYVTAMRSRKTLMEKWGYVMGQMSRDIKAFGVEHAYAYNSPFDERVFAFNQDWFKTLNPLDNVAIHDIRGYVHNLIAFNPHFQEWCERNEQFTEQGNYSTTAETIYRYMFNDIEFIEAHTALADSEIECAILLKCAKVLDITQDFKCYMTIPRPQLKTLTIDYDGEKTSFDYMKMTKRKDTIYLKSKI